MFNSKNLIKSASVGFVLSFLISVIASGRITVALFRGLIFGVIFALLAFTVEFVYKKFLDVGGSSESPAFAEPVTKSSKRGSYVNITIDDENLTEDANGPKFNVEKTVSSMSTPVAKRPLRSESSFQPIKDTVSESSPSAYDSGAAPAEPVAEQEKTESAAKSSTPAQSAAAKKAAKRAADAQEIDALPDIGGFMEEAASEGADGEIIKNTDFAEEGMKADAPSRASLVEDVDVSKHDTKVIASAIRTLLKKEDA